MDSQFSADTLEYELMLNATVFTGMNFSTSNLCKYEDNILPFMFSKSQWLSHFGAGLAYILILQNIIIIRIFLKPKLLSPVSILLSVLALCDTLSVFFWFVPEHIGAIFNWYNGTAFGIYSMVTASFEQFPFCMFGYWSRNILSSGFHSSAIVITTTLGLQKIMVMVFPLFSKSHLNKKCAVIVSLSILIVCLGLEMPYAFFFRFSPTNNGGCCKTLRTNHVTVKKFFDSSHYLRSGILLVSIVIQITTTLYITSRLTFLRKTLWLESKAVRTRNRRSSVIVIYITLIFILSELPSVIVSISLDLRIASSWMTKTLQYLPHIISFGCFFNFWLYLIMSQRFRRELQVSRNSWRRRTRSSYIIV